jgi:hypothetical protein
MGAKKKDRQEDLVAWAPKMSKPNPPPLPIETPIPDVKALVHHIFKIDITNPVVKADCTLILRNVGVEAWFHAQPEYVDAKNLAESVEAIEDSPENLEDIAEAQVAREAALKEMNDATVGLRGRTTSIILAFKNAVDGFFTDVKDELKEQIKDLDSRKEKLLRESNDRYVEDLNEGGVPSPPPAILAGKKITYVPVFDAEGSSMGLMIDNLDDEMFLIDEKKMAAYITARGFGVKSKEAAEIGISVVSGVTQRKIPKKRSKK